MSRMTRLVLLVAALAACGGSSKPAAKPDPGPGVVADPIPTTPGPDCATTAEKLSIVAQADSPAQQAEFQALVQKHCTDDKWSDEARSCFATAENDAEAEGCASKLTEAQRKAIGARETPSGTPAPAMSPPPAPPATKSKTRGPAKRSSDPCEGGEASSDPCEGGE